MNSGLINLAKKHNCALLYYPGGSNNYKNLNNINNPTLYIIYSECYQYISTMTPNMQPLILIEIFDTNKWMIPFGYKKLYEIFLESNNDLPKIGIYLENNTKIQSNENILIPEIETQNSLIDYFYNCNIS